MHKPASRRCRPVDPQSRFAQQLAARRTRWASPRIFISGDVVDIPANPHGSAEFRAAVDFFFSAPSVPAVVVQCLPDIRQSPAGAELASESCRPEEGMARWSALRSQKRQSGELS